MTLQEKLEKIYLFEGSHRNPEEGMCVMEAAAWFAGEEHSDHPKCVSPVIAEFLRKWNDSLPGEARNRLLRPLIPIIIGTNTTPKDESRRSKLATDWLLRVNAPTFLKLVPSNIHYVESLKSELSSTERLYMFKAAWAATAKLAEESGRVAWVAAIGMIRNTALDAARSVTLDTVEESVRFAVLGAQDAAAISFSLEINTRSIVTKLQKSAQKLVRQMCAVGRET